MKKISILLFAMLMISASITAKQTPIVGKWLLTKVEMDGKSEEVYQEVEFKSDGYLAMMGRVLGEWSIDKKAKNLTIDSDMVKEFAGVRKIEKHSKTELILVGKNDKMFFTALDPKSIEKENKKSKLVGTWIIKTEEGDNYLTLELPDTFKSVTKTEYSTSKSGGNWYYNSKEKTIVFIAHDRALRGKSKVIVKDKEFTLEKDGSKIIAVKQAEKELKKASEIERLSFTQEDFYNDEGNPKYEADAEKLPWKDQYKIYETLKEIKNLDYQMSTLVEDTKAFEVKNLSANLVNDLDYEQVLFDNIFGGFDRKSMPDETEMPTLNIGSNNDNYTYVPFPYEIYTFRIVSNDEQLTVKAGTFTCTTVELFSDNEEKIKLWLINDKPGVVAKIIIEKEDLFGAVEYKMFELTKIIEK
jgi:hypothetical protein